MESDVVNLELYLKCLFVLFKQLGAGCGGTVRAMGRHCLKMSEIKNGLGMWGM